MTTLISLLLIGISLSMDAFSLSMSYGITKINKNDKIILALIVAGYHFVMPIIGFIFSNVLIKIRIINISIVASIILVYVGIDLIFSKEEKMIINNLINYFLFGLSVSLDSLTVGIGLRAITNNFLLASIIFSISSLIFTIIGLNIGNYIGKHLSKYSKFLGGIILIILGIIMLYNH